jgi:hypothetical protein
MSAMWWWLARFRCAHCGEIRATGKRALRSPRRPQLAICEECLDTWERTGQRCTRCWTPVRDRLEVGLLADTGSFVHVDCGGARVFGGHTPGRRRPDGPAADGISRRGARPG